jgi:MoxR-like ATPase
MTYSKTFEPNTTKLGKAAGGDGRDGSVYVYTDMIVLAVKTAIATGRPLLLYGLPGTGKSSLASFVARTMNWNYFEQVITSRTQAQDLQWSFDAVRRLRDARTADADLGPEAYIEPRVLWWGFDCESAAKQGLRPAAGGEKNVRRPPGVVRGDDHPSVVLIDEIDKADPDVPNDLLVVLGSQRFQVGETHEVVEPKHRPLIFITTNDERDLPRALLRRCVIHTLGEPDRKRLIDIALDHFEAADNKDDLFGRVADKVVSMRSPDKKSGARSPSTAEYLDAIRACVDFGVGPGESKEWKIIESAVLKKERE